MGEVLHAFKVALVLLLSISMMMKGTEGIRFTLQGEECFSQKVEYDHDSVFASFVVIKADSHWGSSEEARGVDLVIKGPSGEQIHDVRDKTSEKHEFVATTKGVYHFCFTNKSPYPETVDFDVRVGHLSYHEQHAKDEHISPLMERLEMLQAVLQRIEFEEHYLEVQTEQQEIINKEMSLRAIYKATFESLALAGASVLQVYLLKRLFERKFGVSRV